MSSNLSVQFAKKQVDKALFESLYSNPYKFIQCSLDQLTHWEGVAPKMLVIINLFIQRATFSKGAHFTFPLRAIQKKTGFNKAHIIETIYQMEIMGLLKVNRRKNPEFTNMKRNNKQLPRGLKDIMHAGDIDLPNEYTLSKFFFIQEIRNKIKKFLPACRWFVPLVAFTISQALASLSLSLIQVPNVINNFSKSPRMEMIKRRVIRFTIPYKYSVFKAAACNYIKKEKEELLKKEKEKESSYMKHMADLALRALERKASLARQEDPTALPRHESVATGCAADKEGVKEG
ncbi:MAG: hypothetical protein Q8Q33_01985, partial [Chlamydiota bacterium]|nr:hypothetical protein [Chlamydiota bacterium]